MCTVRRTVFPFAEDDLLKVAKALDFQWWPFGPGQDRRVLEGSYAKVICRRARLRRPFIQRGMILFRHDTDSSCVEEVGHVCSRGAFTLNL